MNTKRLLLNSFAAPAAFLSLAFAAPAAPAAAQADAAPAAKADNAPAAPAADKEQDQSELMRTSDFMMHYFQKPEPDKIDALIRQWAGFFPKLDECSAIPSTLVFFGEVFKANPDRVEGWMQTVATLPEEWQEIFEWSQRYARGEEQDVTAVPSMSPEVFDACWGGFMASGEAKYPEFVLRVACMDEAPDCIDMSIRAASWSCCSFIINYPEMKVIARNWLAQASERQRENFALRANDKVQQAVFDKVLVDEARKAYIEEQRKAEAREQEEQMEWTREFTKNYFRQPDPAGIDKLITLSASIDPQAQRVNAAILRMFYGEILKSNRNRLAGWEATIAQQPVAWQQVLAWSIRYAHGDEEHPLATSAPTRDTLLACIGGYMATGNGMYPLYLLKLATAAEDAPIHDMAAAALASGAVTYAEMKQLARKWFNTASEEQKLAFARRANAETQQALLDKVLHAAPAQEDSNDEE